jgi:multicomponent Na+:H+ antiporter subunit G
VTEWLTAALLAVGGAFMLIAAVGIVRMPDLFTRMQAGTKAGTLAIGCILLAVAVHFDDFGVGARAVLVIGFFVLTAPVAAHVIARAAYVVGVPLWEGTVRDELRGRYDPDTHELRSGLDDVAPVAHPPTGSG